MENVRLKKIIVIATAALCLWLWYVHHPRIIESGDAGTRFEYSERRIGPRSVGALPLVIALHGNGDTMDHFAKTLFGDIPYSVRLVLIQGVYKHGMGYAWPLAGPDARKYGDALADIVRKLIEKYPSPAKPVLVGFSGGACMAYYQAAAYPELYSTIIPVSGRLDAAIAPQESLAGDNVRIRALHGSSDDIIGFAAGRGAVDLLTGLGADASLIQLRGGHLAVFTSGRATFLDVLKKAVE